MKTDIEEEKTIILYDLMMFLSSKLKNSYRNNYYFTLTSGGRVQCLPHTGQLPNIKLFYVKYTRNLLACIDIKDCKIIIQLWKTSDHVPTVIELDIANQNYHIDALNVFDEFMIFDNGPALDSTSQ